MGVNRPGARAATRDLAAIVGEEGVTIPADSASLRDATETRGLVGEALGVVRPRTPAETAEIVRWSARNEVPITPRGGGTGYSGGAVPHEGSLVVSVERLRGVREIVPEGWRMTVEAGLTTGTVARLAAENGLWFPPNPGAAEQSQLGGNVATNAGGPRSLRYGPVRSWLTGLEVVLASGELLRVGGATRKNVETLDLTGLVCGSEGTLGIVTAAWLKLIPRPESLMPVIALYETREAGIAAVSAAMASGTLPMALEYLDGTTLRATAASFPMDLPEGSDFLVVAEVAGAATVAAAEREILVETLSEGASMLQTPDGRAEIEAWTRWRDGVSMAVVALKGGKLSEDLAVPPERLGEALAMIDEVGRSQGVEVTSWGHAGDGNIHATVLADRLDPEELALAERAATALLEVPRALDGALSGEHGIGLIKREAAALLPPELLRAQAAVKTALDPDGLMNPHRKLPASDRVSPAANGGGAGE